MTTNNKPALQPPERIWLQRFEDGDKEFSMLWYESDLRPLADLPPEKQRPFHAIEYARVVDGVVATVDQQFVDAFKDTAIKCHIGFKHDGPWEKCEWIECEDRRKLIQARATSTIAAPVRPSSDSWHRWFERLGDKASAEVVNATADLVTDERLAALVDAKVLPSIAAPQDELVDEVQHRMDQVVEAAVEWHQAGREGGGWLDAADKLANAIDSLLELRSQKSTPTGLRSPR